MTPRFICSIIILLAVGLIGAYIMLTTGALAWDFVYQGILDRLFGESTAWNALLDERLPRLIVLACTGASLAVSGAVMQSLLNNPLAAPSVLGISSGSSLLVLIVLITGFHQANPWSIPAAAIIGALGVLLLITLLWKKSHDRPFSDLILLGIALSTLLLTIQGALLYAYRDHWQLIQTVTEWEAGSSYDRSWKHVNMQLPLVIVGLAICWIRRNEINLLGLGQEEALTLGVDVTAVRWSLIFSISLLTGGSIAALGSIPFFGLIMPHLLRKLQGPNHRTLIPLCIVGGAVTLIIFDDLLRLLGYQTLTIGNLSAVCGGIFFLGLLLKRNPMRVL